MPGSNSNRQVKGWASSVLGVLLTLLSCAPCLAADPVAATRAALQQAIQRSVAQHSAPVIARDVFLQPPSIGEVGVAPDGRHLSYLEHDGQRADVWLHDIASGQRHRVASDVRGIGLAWSGDGRHLWLADADGLAVIDSTTRSARRVARWDPLRAQEFWTVDAHAPGYAILHERTHQNGIERHRYLRIDLQGKTQLLHEATLPLVGALLTPDGQLAYAAAYDGLQYDTVIRQYTAAGVRDLLRCSGIEVCRLVGYNAAQSTLWLLSHHGEDKLALKRWQRARWETLHRDPNGLADADALLWDPENEDWRAIAYYGDRRRWHAHRADAQATLAALQRHLPDANLTLSASRDGRLWLVRAEHSTWRLARHFLYRPGEDRLQPLFVQEDAAANGVAPEHLSSAQPVSWRASDGMLLHGYVYLPLGVAPAKAPLIAWLHGGPIARLDDKYDPRIQLLVNRGYAVFLPNFRASSGYGLNYTLSAQGDVGHGRVLADIVDGLDALLAQGIGDRERQAVMGQSFGGYASLLAVSHYPRRFRFAFASAAPTDYGWIKQWQAEHESASLRGDRPIARQFALHGLAFEDPAWREKMQRESPLAALPNVRAPIYLWAGTQDDRVPLKSLIHYAAEARRQNKALTLLIDPDAGHEPGRMHSADAWLYLMESAAHRHFQGGVTPPSPELQAFLRQNARIDSDRGVTGDAQ